MANLWDQRDGETSRAWAAFCAYRDLPAKDRNIEAAWRSLNGSEPAKTGQNRPKSAPSTWTEWAFNHDWKARAAAFDREQDRKQRDLFDRAQQEEARRFQAQLRRDKANFARVARAAMKKGLLALDKADAEQISFKDAVALLNAAARAIKDANEYEMVDLGLDQLMGLLNERDDSTDEGGEDD